MYKEGCSTIKFLAHVKWGVVRLLLASANCIVQCVTPARSIEGFFTPFRVGCIASKGKVGSESLYGT